MNEWRQGWRALVAGFAAMSVGWNFANIAAGLFLKPMQADFGWSRTELSFGPIAGMIVALMLPVTGLLLDRFGARRLAIAGFLAIASAFFTLAAVPPVKPLFYLAVLWLGLSGGLANSIVVSRAVAPWFNRNFGAAMGIMMTGASAAGAIFVPLLAYVIPHFGWRQGFVALGMITLIVGLPLILLWFREPGDMVSGKAGPKDPPAPFREIFSSMAFWQIAMGSAVAALPIGGFVGHLVPLLTDRGLAVGQAAGLASVFAIAIGIGRIGNGILLDRLHPPLVTFVTLSLAAAGAMLLGSVPIASATLIVAGAIGLIGLAQGAEGDYIKFFSMKLFGLANYARVASMMAMVISAGMALGGIAFARVYDLSGSYMPAIYASAALYAAGGLIFLTIRMTPPKAIAGRKRAMESCI